jgi:hypothetical protein
MRISKLIYMIGYGCRTLFKTENHLLKHVSGRKLSDEDVLCLSEAGWLFKDDVPTCRKNVFFDVTGGW